MSRRIIILRSLAAILLVLIVLLYGMQVAGVSTFLNLRVGEHRLWTGSSGGTLHSAWQADPYDPSPIDLEIFTEPGYPVRPFGFGLGLPSDDPDYVFVEFPFWLLLILPAALWWWSHPRRHPDDEEPASSTTDWDGDSAPPNPESPQEPPPP